MVTLESGDVLLPGDTGIVTRVPGLFSGEVAQVEADATRGQQVLRFGALEGQLVGAETLTALGLAARLGHVEIVSILVEAGAEVEAGLQTPLLQASEYGHHDSVRILLDCRADIQAAAADSCSALDMAAAGGHVEVVRCLLDAWTGGASSSSSSSSAPPPAVGMEHAVIGPFASALMWACRCGCLEVMPALLRATSDSCTESPRQHVVTLLLAADIAHSEKYDAAAMATLRHVRSVFQDLKMPSTIMFDIDLLFEQVENNPCRPRELWHSIREAIVACVSDCLGIKRALAVQSLQEQIRCKRLRCEEYEH